MVYTMLLNLVCTLHTALYSVHSDHSRESLYTAQCTHTVPNQAAQPECQSDPAILIYRKLGKFSKILSRWL
jgi:hypothetical protein